MYCENCGKKLEDGQKCQCENKKEINGEQMVNRSNKRKRISIIPLCVFIAGILILGRYMNTKNSGSKYEKQNVINQTNDVNYKQEVENKSQSQNNTVVESNTETTKENNNNQIVENNISNTNDYPIYSMDFLKQYLEVNNIEIPTNKYKSEMEKAIDNNSELIALNASDDERVRYTATAGIGDFYYVGELKNNVPNGWGKIIRFVTAYETEDFNSNAIVADIREVDLSWGIPEGEQLIPILVYIGKFKDGYYDGYGWKYQNYFDDDFVSEDIIGLGYSRYSNDIAENILYSCNPLEYMGEFKKGVYHGEGVRFVYYTQIFSSPLMQDEVGVEDLQKHLDITIATFKDGNLDGKGKNYFCGNLLYEGEYTDWIYHGKGVLYYLGTSQKQYEGQFRTGEYDGKGTLYNMDGTVKYSGKWDMGDYAN